MRKRIFQVVETANEHDVLSNIYDVFMMIVIIASLVPLAFKNDLPFFYWVDKIAVVIFIIDYILRLFTADLKLQKGIWSFLLYPFTPMAILDLLCILPSLSLLSGGFRILKVFRLFRTLRVFRVFKAVRYSKSIKMIKGVFVRQRRALLTVGLLAVAYVLISALVVFNVEPDSFGSFFDAVYWATVSLTTVGYGDIYPVTVMGRVITMISSIFGIAIIALPSGIITAGFLDELNKLGTETESKDPLEASAPEETERLDEQN